MAINVWRTPEEQRYIETRKAVRKADQEERKRLLDEQKRAELWADFDSEAILAEALEAQERAREAQRQQLLKQEIGAELLAIEMDQAASETSDALNQVKPK